jgi:hypothetical protein
MNSFKYVSTKYKFVYFRIFYVSSNFYCHRFIFLMGRSFLNSLFLFVCFARFQSISYLATLIFNRKTVEHYFYSNSKGTVLVTPGMSKSKNIKFVCGLNHLQLL